MQDDEIRDEGENFTQWRRIAVDFTLPGQRAGDTVAAPIAILTAAPELGQGPVVCHQMGARQAREIGTRLIRYADRLDAESGAAPPDLQGALDIALNALGRAVLVLETQPTAQRNAVAVTNIGRELRDSAVAARLKAGIAGRR